MSNIDTITSLIEQGQVDSVKTLLATSPVKHDDDAIIMLLHASIESMNLDIMRYLLDTYKPDSQSPLFRDKVSLASVGHGKTEAFKTLTAYHPSILTWDLSHLGDALGHAVLTDNFPLAHFILDEAGCDPNKSQLCYRPPIEHTAYQGKYEMTKLLLKHGARINGTKALYEAMQSGNVDMLSLLMSIPDSDINTIQPVERSEGPGGSEEVDITPGPVLNLAVQTRNKAMVHALVTKFGADPLIKDQSGKTAVDWARDNGDPAISKQLDPAYRPCQVM
ncbi:ankyrin repeat-containing domain protein [Aspergillus taichungensis]|uniref:Ankyrin repeat-containing domain protein n=1 Tax=Aspergillus taichungensis TaxID=482145 RepID=A0A2J5HQT1_9EURO|nr:ankyrin repeat-containing domain protein [Aspergillus taichungensis]